MPSILTSWKEISEHLGKGVRTVQRWEMELGLPVHRADGGTGRAIFAVREELDAWARSHPRAPAAAMVGALEREMGALREEIRDLRNRVEGMERQRAAPYPELPASSAERRATLLDDLRQARQALRAAIERSQQLRGESRAARGAGRSLSSDRA